MIEPLLSFNGSAAFRAFSERLSQVISDLCDMVMQTAAANLGGQYPDVAATLHVSLSNLASQGLIDGQIGASDWRAFLAEWGSGSEMDRGNPDLTAYMDSELWNPVRNGFAITGRPEGPYLGLDGEIHDATGKLSGVDLETLSKSDPAFQAWMAKVGLPPDAFQPKIPLHFMRDALESNRNLIMNQLNAVIETFRFGDFLM